MVIQITNVIVFSILYAKFWCMYVKMEVQVVKYKHLVLENSFLCMCKETIFLGLSNYYFLGK